MTQEDYKDKLRVIEEESAAKKSALARQYAFTNNPVNIGDIIQDHRGRIKVDKIQYTTSFSSNYPQCVYSGVEVTKSGSPDKKGTRRNVCQSNLVQEAK